MKQALKLVARRAPESWQCFVLPVDRFPIPHDIRSDVFAFVERLVAAAQVSERLALEFFLQFNHLHHEDGPAVLGQGGKDWLPQLGLGVWPDREEPTMWTIDEFRNLAPGEMMRPLTYQLFRVTTGADARRKARDVFFGTGTGLQMFLPEGDTALLERATKVLLPRITEPSFRAFEYYIPLLDAASIENATPTDLSDWLGGTRLYVRESVEDSGILIVSAFSLTEVLRRLRAVADLERGDWELPLPYVP